MEAITAAKASVQGNIQEVGFMRLLGVEFLTGTDAGFPFIFPGFSLHDELALLVQAGWTTMEALQAATRNPARYLGLLHSLGTLEKGKVADVVLLDANPLDAIRNTRQIAAVVINGNYLSKEALKKMLAKMEGGAERN